MPPGPPLDSAPLLVSQTIEGFYSLCHQMPPAFSAAVSAAESAAVSLRPMPPGLPSDLAYLASPLLRSSSILVLLYSMPSQCHLSSRSHRHFVYEWECHSGRRTRIGMSVFAPLNLSLPAS